MTQQAPPAADPFLFPTPPTRVEINAAGHQVVIETVAPLDTVAGKALELWRDTDTPAIGRAADVVGFTASEPIYSALMPPEVDLPHRVATTEDSVEYQRPGR